MQIEVVLVIWKETPLGDWVTPSLTVLLNPDM